MKSNVKLNKMFCGVIILLLTSGLFSLKTYGQVSEVGDDKSLSPYFFVQSDDSQTDCLPLKSTGASVNIAGIIADVTITQEYKNEGKKPIEAIYVFPASTRAAVYSMVMTIGERVIKATIKEREQARKDYEDAKKQGKSASLLEQQRPNVFQMNVANIMPGDLIKVEMKYTEMLVPENGVYEFVYPTVVGPRYSNKAVATAVTVDKWVANPYTTEGKKPLYSFNINVIINAGLPLKDVRCDSHNMDIRFKGQNVAEVLMKQGNEFEGNRDFILHYRLQGEAVQSGLLLYKGVDENFFLAMMQPPQRINPSKIPQREYVFIVDVSGSMHGFPLDISKRVLRDLIGNLRATDRFNVILFAGASNLMATESVAAKQENITKAISFIDQQQGSGGTELLPALEKALSLKAFENMARSFVILTDGFVDIEKEAFDLVRQNLGKANFFAFGIGTSVNRFLMEGLAHSGAGEPFIVENPALAPVMAAKFRKYIESPVLTNINISYPGFNVYDVEPLSVPDLFAERPVIIYGKWKGNAAGKIILTGNSGNTAYRTEIPIETSKIIKNNGALRYLWARKRIQMLDDYSKANGVGDYKDKLVSLGLKYNLLTAYTSFIAIDTDIRNKTGQTETVTQPLPLPEGVSNYAVGGAIYMKSMAAPQRSTINSSVALEKVALDELVVEAKKDMGVAEDSTFTIVEESATFMGGDLEKFKKYIAKQFVFPASVKGSGISGKVVVQFVVDKNGKVTKVKIIRGVDPAIDKELIRIIEKSPAWKPGKHGGKPVSQTFTIPVSIKE